MIFIYLFIYLFIYFFFFKCTKKNNFILFEAELQNKWHFLYLAMNWIENLIGNTLCQA